MTFALRCLLAAAMIVPAADAALAQKARSASASSASLDCVPGPLQQVLAEVQQKFGPVSILSTHRPDAVVAGTGRPSLHRQCRAVDFRISGSRRAVIAFLRQDPRVQGLGIYRSGHIHIDNGPYRVTWNK